MKIFIFQPSSDFVGKIEVASENEVHSAIAEFASKTPSLRDYSYAEGFGKLWTIVARSPFKLEEGRISRTISTWNANASSAVSSSLTRIPEPTTPLLTQIYYACAALLVVGALFALIDGQVFAGLSAVFGGVLCFGLGQAILLVAKIEANTKAAAEAAQKSSATLEDLARQRIDRSPV